MGIRVSEKIRVLRDTIYTLTREDRRSTTTRTLDRLDAALRVLSTPEEIDWGYIEDLVIEAERLDNEIKEEK